MSEAVSVWPECGASIVRGVAHYNDLDLLRAFQQQPQVARHFICLFCRYCSWVDEVIAEQVSREQQAACREQVWLRLYPRLQRLEANSLLSRDPEAEVAPGAPLKLWLAEQTRELAKSFVSPALEAAPEQVQPYLSPALACYLTTGLETLPGDVRFILLLRDRFGWSPARIAAQLKVDGYFLAPEQVDAIVVFARQMLFQDLPADVRALYLATKP
ncbi:MAG: hypothetical protein ACUVRV_01305 [Cyanobacteriota bacterium]